MINKKGAQNKLFKKGQSSAAIIFAVAIISFAFIATQNIPIFDGITGAAVAQGLFTCDFAPSFCGFGETSVLETSGLTNAHAALTGQNDYSTNICCYDATGRNTVTNTGVDFLELSSAGNAHIEQPGSGNYAGNAASIGSDLDPLTCTYLPVSGDCPYPAGCLATMSSTTNAHLGDCNAYELTICCEFAPPPNEPPNPPEDPYPPTGGACTYPDDTVSATVSDPEGDLLNVTLYLNGQPYATQSGVASGSTVTFSLTELDPATTYNWHLLISDGELTTTSEVYTCTTPSNIPPNEPTGYSPTCGSTGDSTDSQDVSAIVSDPDGDALTVTLYLDGEVYATQTGVASGTTVTFSITELEPDTTHTWYLIVSDGVNATTGAGCSFTTLANTPPDEPTNFQPSCGGTGNHPDHQDISVTVNDPEGDAMTVELYLNNGLYATEYNVTSGTIVTFAVTGLQPGTTYTWYIVVSDGMDTTTSATCSFTTPANNPPNEPTDLTPACGSILDDTNTVLGLTVSDPDADALTVELYIGGQLIATEYNVASGTALTFPLPDSLEPDTTYEWYVTISDGTNTVTSETCSFTTPPPPSQGECVRTQGYWKTHKKAWPIDEISIGGISYSKSTAINLMKKPVNNDITYQMFYQLVAAKLNVASGSNYDCIESTIAAADGWMAVYGPVDDNVKVDSSSEAWSVGEPLKNTLDDFNNGLMCAVSCDSLENGE
jgi:hypothetical protein